MNPEMVHGPVGKHDENALVVETGQLPLVLHELGNPATKRLESDVRLGLTLVELAAVAKTAAGVNERALALGAPSPAASAEDYRAWDPLDRLLADLRAIFGHKYGGWKPEIGKNRTMTPVQFVTYPNAEGVTTYPNAEGLALRPISPAEVDLGAGRERDAKKGEGVRVGLLDTRLYPHRLLAGRYVADRDALWPADKGQPNPYYVDGHATHLASLILGEAPAAQLDVRAVIGPMQPDHLGWHPSIWDVARELVRYADSGVSVLNCSWACYTRDGEPPFVLDHALSLITPTILVVAAAGNHGPIDPGRSGVGPADDSDYRERNRLPMPNAPAYPAASPKVVAVGALDGSGRRASFNPTAAGSPAHRASAPWIDVWAPGVDVPGLYFGDEHEQNVEAPVPPRAGQSLTQYFSEKRAYRPEPFNGAAQWTGTSFAAAQVTGAVAARIRAGRTAHEALEELLVDGDRRIRRARPS